jgi:hypothetical protein
VPFTTEVHSHIIEVMQVEALRLTTKNSYASVAQLVEQLFRNPRLCGTPGTFTHKVGLRRRFPILLSMPEDPPYNSSDQTV